jgi:hypothetical protein
VLHPEQSEKTDSAEKSGAAKSADRGGSGILPAAI